MSRRKSPSVSIENNDDGLKTLTEMANGTIIDSKKIDSVVHELVHHRYPMPCARDIKEISGPCKDYDPSIADQFNISYYRLFQSRLKLDNTLRENNDPKKMAKASLEYVRFYEAFSEAELAAAKAIEEGIQKRMEDRKQRDALVYV